MSIRITRNNGRKKPHIYTYTNGVTPDDIEYFMTLQTDALILYRATQGRPNSDGGYDGGC